MPRRDDPTTPEAHREATRDHLAEADRRTADPTGTVVENAKTVPVLASMGARHEPAGARLLSLENVRVASPCTASWDDMSGDERARLCGSCHKTVYNLSAMAREEAERLLVRHEASLCVRLYRRADGTVLTNDCPVGVRRKRRRRALVATVGAGAMAATATMALLQQGRPARAMMSAAVAIDPPRRAPEPVECDTLHGEPSAKTTLPTELTGQKPPTPKPPTPKPPPVKPPPVKPPPVRGEWIMGDPF